MKLMKYITGCSAALLLLAACSKEEGPSVDDYFLNYEIPEIPVTEDYQVGIFYYKGNDITTRPNGDANFTRWELLTLTDKELSTKNNYNNLTPQVMPESQKDGYLQPDAGSQSYRMIPMVQQHVDDCIEAGANFIILPEVGADLGKGPGNQSGRFTVRHNDAGTLRQRRQTPADATPRSTGSRLRRLENNENSNFGQLEQHCRPASYPFFKQLHRNGSRKGI